jgi:hypothetical protein
VACILLVINRIHTFPLGSLLLFLFLSKQEQSVLSKRIGQNLDLNHEDTFQKGGGVQAVCDEVSWRFCILNDQWDLQYVGGKLRDQFEGTDTHFTWRDSNDAAGGFSGGLAFDSRFKSETS